MSERKYNNQYGPTDSATQLKDAGLIAATAAAQVGGAARVLDLGEDEFRDGASGVGHAPYVRGDVVIIPTAIENGNGDETFGIQVQLSTHSDFSANVVNRALLVLGQQLVTQGSPADVTGLVRYTLPVDNEFGNRTYRYMRLVTHVAGTIATGINYVAHFHKSAM